MSDFYAKFTGTIDRRSPHNEGNPEDPILRENWLPRDNRLRKPGGTEKAITTTLSDIPRWGGRYHTIETGIITPKSFFYTDDGKLWHINEDSGVATEIKSNLKSDAFPRHWLYKTSNQTIMYLVDGKNLLRYDGNNDHNFTIVTLADADGNSVEPIDVIEHKDRLLIISKTRLFISKNLEPEVFDDANDSLEIIIGSGKGTNLSFGKIEEKLYILTTEGIFVVAGDVISALAATFEIRLVEERNIISGRSACKVEKAIVFLADDYELWQFDGTDSEMLTYKLKLKDYIDTTRQNLDKAVSIYQNNYYMLSFVEKGATEPNIELFWDALENKIDIVKGRHVSCYMKTDSTIENEYLMLGRSDIGSIMYADRGFTFDGEAISSKLWTRDIIVKKGRNVRFTAFYPEFEPTGDLSLLIEYILDGRLSQPSGTSNVYNQNLRGEVKTLGADINIQNQAQFIGRFRPRINYSRGTSIAFKIEDATLRLRASFLGMGIDFIQKEKVKSKTIGA